MSRPTKKIHSLKELLALARTAGVQILEVQGAGTPCAAGDTYLQSPAASSAGKLR